MSSEDPLPTARQAPMSHKRLCPVTFLLPKVVLKQRLTASVNPGHSLPPSLAPPPAIALYLQLRRVFSTTWSRQSYHLEMQKRYLLISKQVRPALETGTSCTRGRMICLQ